MIWFSLVLRSIVSNKMCIFWESVCELEHSNLLWCHNFVNCISHKIYDFALLIMDCYLLNSVRTNACYLNCVFQHEDHGVLFIYTISLWAYELDPNSINFPWRQYNKNIEPNDFYTYKLAFFLHQRNREKECELCALI